MHERSVGREDNFLHIGRINPKCDLARCMEGSNIQMKMYRLKANTDNKLKAYILKSKFELSFQQTALHPA